MAKKLDIDDPNDPVIRYTNRFRLVANRYPLTVTYAYDGDIEAAAKDDDVTVANRVREWEISEGIEPRDWIANGREERHGDPDERRAGWLRSLAGNRPRRRVESVPLS
jgi:hypothetical protein